MICCSLHYLISMIWLLQLKIFTTAAFAVMMLGRVYSNTKWRALMLLVLGCILVASPTFNRPPECDYDSYIQTYVHTSNPNPTPVINTVKRYVRSRLLQESNSSGNISPDKVSTTDIGEPNEGISLLNSMIGLGAVVVMVIMSGYSSIYFEGMLKQQGAKITIW